MLHRVLTRYAFNILIKEPIHTTAELVDKTVVNHDSYVYRLKVVDKPFELKIGEHFRITETIKTYDVAEGEEVTRKYTPINPLSQKVLLSSHLGCLGCSGQNLSTQC